MLINKLNKELRSDLSKKLRLVISFFFDNEEERIIHVGVLLSSNEVIHASGKVRIDKIDHQGIFNQETGKYTHNLRLIKRII